VALAAVCAALVALVAWEWRSRRRRIMRSKRDRGPRPV
jgi:hypothetical protein